MARGEVGSSTTSLSAGVIGSLGLSLGCPFPQRCPVICEDDEEFWILLLSGTSHLVRGLNLTFYLVGPSGAGKTTVAKELESRGAVRLVDTDCEWKDSEGGEEGELRTWASVDVVLPALEEWDAAEQEPPFLVVIGAGTQCIDCCGTGRPIYDWLAIRRERVIAILCSPESIAKRRPHHNLTSARCREFAPEREAIYQLPGLVIDSDLHSAAQIADKIEEFLRRS